MSTTAPTLTGIEAIVAADLAKRQALGLKKYGATLADSPAPLRDWLIHAYEESLDLPLYLRRAIAAIDGEVRADVPPEVATVVEKPAALPFVAAAPIPLGIKRLHPDARMPTYATDGSMCFDLYACDVKNAKTHARDCRATIVRTGLAFAIPQGWAMEIYSRSGQGFKDAVRLCNSVGQMDQDYTDEVMVGQRYDGDDNRWPMLVKDGDRIAQAKLVPLQRASFEWVEDIAATGRAGGFGHSGV